MIRLRFANTSTPQYMTRHSSGADLKAAKAVTILPGTSVAVPTGVWIEGVDWERVPKGMIPELQIRARSGLALKKGICLANGVGTVDADFPDEICVLLLNLSTTSYTVAVGDRIGQLILSATFRIPGLPIGEERTGGFGSTGDFCKPVEPSMP